MPARFVHIDHNTPLLLPPDLRQWVPADHLAHFIMDAVGELALHGVRVNERGTGDAQYPPSVLLGLLIYNYATGGFASRQIGRRPMIAWLCGCSAPTRIPITTRSAPSAGNNANCWRAVSRGSSS